MARRTSTRQLMAHAPINNCTAAALFAAYKPLDVVFIAQAVFSLITLITFSCVIGRTISRRRRMPYHHNLKVSKHSGMFGQSSRGLVWVAFGDYRTSRVSGTVPTTSVKSLLRDSKRWARAQHHNLPEYLMILDTTVTFGTKASVNCLPSKHVFVTYAQRPNRLSSAV